MAIKLTAESFLNVVKRSQLVDKEKLIKLLEQFRANGVDLTDSRAIGNALVEAEAVTRWQCDKLLEGKHKGFFLGKYRLMSLLGKGGMSSVFRADHILMRRTCAIKVLPAKRVKDSSYLERFHREAQAVASLDHPNIVRAYDVDHEKQMADEIHFLVMEHVDGKNLQEIVTDDGTASFVVAAEYLRQAAEGLEHAHKAGLVHRDIKPGNLLVDPNGVVKILDLGLARFFETKEENPLTVAHDEKVLGTADYLAPEQALDSHKVDIRADIYSLGCTIYFVLTGHPPFNEGTLTQRLMWHQTKQPPPIANDRPDIPDSFNAIIEKMMEKKPEDRYQTAGELAEVLRDWLIENGDADWKTKNKGLMAGTAVPVAKPVVAKPVDAQPVEETPTIAETDQTPAAVAPVAETMMEMPDEAAPAAPVVAEREAGDNGLADFLSNLDPDASAASAAAPAIDTSAPAPPESAPIQVPEAEAAVVEKPADKVPVAEAPVVDVPTAKDATPKAAPVAPDVEPVVAKPVEEAPAVPPVAAPVVDKSAHQDEAAAFAETMKVAAGTDVADDTAADPDATFPDFSAIEASQSEQEVATFPDFAAAETKESDVGDVPDFTSVGPAKEAAPAPAAPVVQDESAFPDFSAVDSSSAAVEDVEAPVAQPVVAEPVAATPVTPAKATKATRPGGGKKKPIVPIIATVSVVLIAVIGFFVFANGDDSGDSKGDKVSKNSKSGKNKKKKSGKKSSSSTAKANGSQGANQNLVGKREFTVGPSGDFKSIADAMAFMKSHKSEFDATRRSRKKIVFKVAGGETFKKPIHLDDSYPAGIRLIAEGDQNAILEPSGGGPAVRLDNVEFFQMEGFDIKTNGMSTAIELKGYLTATQLRRLNVSGFSKNGIHAVSTYGVLTPDEVVLEGITLTSGTADAVGLRVSEEGLTRTKILKCRFFGKMAVGVLFEGEGRFLEFRESIFSETDIGMKFVGGDRVWSDFVVANNTFHSVSKGVVFTNLPKTNSKEIGFYHNLFASISGPELVIENGYDLKEFNSRLSVLGGGTVNNWSDRADPGAEPKGGEHLIVINPGTQRVSGFEFQSTDRSDPKFLAPKPNTPYGKIGAGRGLKPYVGAVAP